MAKKKSKDINIIASQITKQATDETHIVKNHAAVALGRLGGLKGGKARANRLTPEHRSEIARKAAHARWQK
jgi:hypothetical protein